MTLVTIRHVSAQTIYPSDIIGEQIRFYNVAIDINLDGTLHIEERIQYDFGPEKKRGIFRTIPLIKENKDGKKFKMDVSIESVKDEEGKAYTYKVTNENNMLKVRIGDEDIYIDGIKNYVLTYTVSGALTYFSDHDELYWNAIGDDWSVPIVGSSVSVRLPQPLSTDQLRTECFTGYTGSTEKNCTTQIEDNEFFYSTTGLAEGEGMTIVAGFPKDVVAVLEPKEYKDFFDTALGQLVLILMVLSALIWYLIYPLWLPIKWFMHGRDPGATQGAVTAWFDPPTDNKGEPLTPAETGALFDEVVNMHDIAAILIHLAQKGYMRIEERSKNDFYFVKLKDIVAGDGIKDYESTFFTAIFGGKQEIHLKDAQLSSEVEKAREAIYKNLVAYKFFPKNPDEIRKFYAVLTGLAVSSFNLLLALNAAIFGRIMPRKTLEGINAANVAKSLKNFLKSQERQLQFQGEKQLLFEKLLPFAVAFGVERRWAERFKDIELAVPSWYVGYGDYHTMNSTAFVNSLHSSFNSFNSVATPTTSSSGFSSGFSGGSSGGGGGGGGGGSW